MIAPFCVSIIGCGWLGFPLAKVLLSQGYCVKGSTTSLEKIPVLEKAGIFSFCLNVDEKFSAENIGDFFNSDIVVITLPFRRDFFDPREYQKQIKSIVLECEKSGKVSFVIFTSSTSVYPDNIGSATEDLIFEPDNARSMVLADIENELLANRHFAATVIRLAGLYGAGRKIGAFLAGQKKIAGANNPVNLIHQDDAVGLIVEIIAQNLRGEVFNGCSDFHPTKKELYTKAAEFMGLATPEFLLEDKVSLKIVGNDKVKKVLGYRFLHPDPMKDI